MRKMHAKERPVAPFFAGKNNPQIVLDRHAEMHFHPLEAPLDRDVARSKENHAPSAIRARILGKLRREDLAEGELCRLHLSD